MLLRRENVVAGALSLLDSEGLDGLTMRKLGVALNVRASAMYRHFPNKEALLDAMADRLLDGVGAPLPPTLAWSEKLEVLARRLHAALLQRRDGARVVSGTFAPGPSTMAASNRAAEVLVGAGFPPEQAWEMAFTVFYFVLGHTIEEQSQSRMPVFGSWAARLADSEVPADHPLAQGLQSFVGTDPAIRFISGLRVILAGVQHLAPTGDGDSTRTTPTNPSRTRQ